MRRFEGGKPATKLTAAGLVLACSVSVGTAIVARADSVSDQKKKNDKKIAQLGQQLEGTKASLARAYVNLERTNAAMPLAQQRLVAAQGAQARAEAAQAAAEATEARAIAAEGRARAHNEAVAQKDVHPTRPLTASGQALSRRQYEPSRSDVP
jgi:hypothetical protein